MPAKILRLTGTAVALFMIEAVLGPWILFRAPLAGLGVNLYIVIGLGMLFFGLVRGQLLQDTSRQAFEQEIIDATANKTPSQRWRNRLYTWLFLAMRVSCWPAFEFGLHNFRLGPIAARLRTQFSQGAAVGLYPPETSLSFFLLVLPAAVTAYAALSSPPFVFSVDFLWVMVFTLFLKHLSYLIGVNTVQERLRRGRDSPLLSYALITACDLLGLVLCYNGIVNWPAAAIFDPSALKSIVTRLFALKDFVDAFEHPPQRIIDYCIGVSGLFWWLTLAQSLFHLKDYQRTSLDYLVLAINYTLLGMDDRARAVLDATDVSDKLLCAVKGELYAALGDFDKGMVYAQRFMRQADDVPLPPGDINYIFHELHAGIATWRANSEMLCRYIDFGSAHGLSDVLLSNFALLTSAIGINPSPVARFIEQKGLVDRFSLAYITLMWRADEEREVLVRFDRSEPQSPDARRAIWLCLKALLWPARRKNDKENEAFIEQWSQSSLTEVQQIAVNLDDQLEKIALIVMLESTSNYWTRLGADLGAIAATVAAIDESLRSNEVVRRIRSQLQLPKPPVPSPALVPQPAT